MKLLTLGKDGKRITTKFGFGADLMKRKKKINKKFNFGKRLFEGKSV